jgi:hypothetical protein
MNINTIPKIILTITIISIVQIQFLISGSFESANIHTNSDRYLTFIKQNSTHPINLLDQNWQVSINDDSIFNSVQIPILFKQEVKKLHFKYTLLVPDTVTNHQLRLWFLGLQGIGEVYLNKIKLKHQLNLPLTFYVDVPKNLLNLNIFTLLYSFYA